MPMGKLDKIRSEVVIKLDDLLSLAEYTNAVNLSSKQPQRSVLTGKHASLIRGRGLDFDQVRKYVRGDDIRYIDWKVTARTQKTYLKEYTEERERPVLLVVNQSRSMFFGSKNKLKSVVAAELAGIISHRVIKDKDRIGAIIIGDDKTGLIKPKGGHKHLVQLLQKLADANQELLRKAKNTDNETLLNNTMMALRQLKPVNHLIIFISDFLHYMPSVKQEMAAQSRHNDVVLFKVNDPLELALGDDKWVLSDSQLQISFDGKKADNDKKFTEFNDQRKDQFSQEMLNIGIPILQFNTVEPIHKQLSNYFR